MTSFKAAATAILVFAAATALLEWIAGKPVGVLPLKTFMVFLLTAAAVRCLPWRALVARIHPNQRGFTAVLFLITVRHFTRILLEETRRLLAARALSFPRRTGRGWFRSLAWAVAGVFRASLGRAERFYAGLCIRGLGS